MAAPLSPLLKKSWIKNYLNDLLIWATDLSSLTQRLRKTFTLFKENYDKLNLSKCEINKNEGTFLVKLGAYADAARGLGAHLRDIGP